MSKFKIAALMAVILSLVIAAGCGGSSNVMVGVGETIVTAPIGTGMSGYARNDVSQGVHDELHARSIYVQGSNGVETILMTVAVINMSERIMDSIRDEINERTGIPVDNIVISCTHTHSGPSIGGEYATFLKDRCVESAIIAWENRVPGKVGVEPVEVFGLAMNDRRMLHGGVHMDPEAAVIKIENARGKLLGVFFNFGCHPSALDLHNLLFTEDWPYFSIRGIKEVIGDDVVVGYFQSAQGDSKVGYSAELSAVGAEMYGVRTFEFAEKKGLIMTRAVLEVLPSIKTSGDFEVHGTKDHFDFPRRGREYPYTVAEAERWQRNANTHLASLEVKGDQVGQRIVDFARVEAWLANQAAGRARAAVNAPENPEPLKMSMQAVRLGDIMFVTFPNEVFVEIGVRVKEASPFEKTYILGIASGHGGYIPTRAEFAEGGYAVNGTNFHPDCEDVVVDSALELINRIK